MAATRGRSKAIIVSKQSVNQAGVFLQELPEKPKENLSLREAVGQLRDQIQAALAKGYSYDDLSKMLTDKGIEISPTTLKSYVPAGRRQSSKDKADKTDKAEGGKTRGRRRKTQSEETSVLEIAASQETPPSESPESESEAPAPKRGRRPASATAETKGTRGRRATSSPATRSTRGRQKRS